MSIYLLLYNNDIYKKNVNLLELYKEKLFIDLKTRRFTNKNTKKIFNKLDILLRQNNLTKVINYIIIALQLYLLNLVC